MHFLEVGGIVVTAVVNILLALIILIKSQHKKHVWLFALFSLSATSWTLTNFFVDHSSHGNLLFAKLAFVSVTILVQAFFAFVSNFFNAGVRLRTPVLLGSILQLVIISFDFVVKEVVPQKNLATATIAGPLYGAYITYTIFVLVITCMLLFRVWKRTNDIYVRRQAKIILFGLTVAGLVAVTTNSILPAITNDWRFAKLGPISTIFLVFSIAYAIAKYRLFDISGLVIRSFVYVLTVATLVSAYSAVSLSVKMYLLQSETNTHISTALEIALLAVFGISFTPLRMYFDRLTMRIFFRNHYDAAAVLKMVNDVATHSVDLAKMLHKVASIIKASLLVEYVVFVLVEQDQMKYVGVGKYPKDVGVPSGFQKLFKKYNVLIPSRVDTRHSNERDMEYIETRKIAAIVRLAKVGETRRKVESEGYILVGRKRSGKTISVQDERLLELMSGYLATAIQNLLHLDEIVDFNVKLQHEVSDATRELKAKNTRLRELDHNKDEFVSMASHQLRTPLTSVKGYLSMVLDGDAGELKPAQKELLEQAYTSTQRMVYLIADLLNLSRLNTGKFVINSEPTSLAAIIEGEIQQIQKTAEVKGVRVSFFCDPSVPNISLDQMKMRQVIMNFIDNAIYYTPEGGRVEVSLRQNNGAVTFSVADNGIGVPKAEHKELFTKFYRASNARKTRPDGTGLGLYMAKRIIDAQGGRLIFKSTEGKGSLFGFTFTIK